MKRITISLPDDLAAAVRREADRCRVPVSELARDALAARLGLDEEGPRVLPFVGIIRSAYSDTSARVDEILAEEWDPAGSR